MPLSPDPNFFGFNTIKRIYYFESMMYTTLFSDTHNIPTAES